MKNILILIMNLPLYLYSQNLVPNGSFEDTLSCPDNLDQISKSIGWSAFRQSPDYFNMCSQPGGYCGVPQNQFDFQSPHTGSAYSGLFTFNSGTDYREYIGVQLTQSLIIGHQYFVSFFVNRVSKSIGQHKNIATNKLGIRFTNTLYTAANPEMISNYAHVYCDTIISDTLNWVNISGYFVADSTYNFLSIGNFFQDSLTSIIKFDSLANAAYYFIDDISVIDSMPQGMGYNDLNFQIKIYPNPSFEYIIILGNHILRIEIFDMLGQNYNFSFKPAVNFQKIDVSQLSKGAYFIKIQTLNYSYNKKLIIQ